MCGIAGFISINGTLNENDLQHFVKCQHHRGPDASGTFYHNGIGLAHNRLSILDISEKANQPFSSEDGRYQLVYNGEVYNFSELKKLLNKEMKTSSDTEVVLEMFIRYGSSCVEYFRGMFAFVIYDQQMQCLWMFRDRFGIKPFYYYLTENTFIFSSELQAIAQLQQIKNKLSIDAVASSHFLHLGLFPGEMTIYKEIKTFPAGASGKISKDLKLNIQYYWKLSDHVKQNKDSFKDARAKIKDLLFDSVREHLISDVPVGLFLSGGIDSSLLAAIATQFHPNINTFTIGLQGQHDEAPYARNIAAYLKTNHHENYLSDEKSIDLLEKVIDVYGQPFGDTSAIPTLFISEIASKKVKVALSGEGADEIFLGYNSYNWAKRLEDPLIRNMKWPIKILSGIFNNNKIQKLNKLLTSSAGTSNAEVYSVEHGFYSQKETIILGKDYKGYAFGKGTNALTEQILFEIEISLKEGLLVKMDRASMHYGLEARVPYLDHRLVEYVLSTDITHRLYPPKHILKDILFEMVPAKYFNKKKWGFGLSSEHAVKQYILKNVRHKKTEANNLPGLFASFMLEKMDS